MGPADLAVRLVPLLLSLSVEPHARDEAGEAPALQLRIASAMAREALTAAGRAAAERLDEPGCAAVFADFKDARGHTLQQRLDQLGRSARGQLQAVFFYDGAHRRGCQRRRTLAVTEPGSYVVHVCPQFAWSQRRDPEQAPEIVIHELLHTLGLGENPPSSEEISRHVRARCGR